MKIKFATNVLVLFSKVVFHIVALFIKIDNREVKEVDHIKYLGTVVTRDGYCTREIKMRISMAKEAFNRKISLLIRKLKIELKNRLVRCYVWNVVEKLWNGVHLEEDVKIDIEILSCRNSCS